MSTRNAVLALAALIAATLAISLYLYPALPAQVPIHWGIEGKADGWAPKGTAVAMAAGMMALFGAMLVALPWLSPRQFTVEGFRGTFNYVFVVIGAMLFCIHVLSLLAVLYPRADFGRALISVIFVFFALIGNVVGKTRKNFWMGWRTPWTLASDAVWVATHRLAARLMFGFGLLGAAAVWLGVPIPWILTLFVVMMFVPYVYSLVLYKRLESETAGQDSPHAA